MLLFTPYPGVSSQMASDLAGLIPLMLDADDPRPAADQINDRYAHGGGWSPMQGWRVGAGDTIRYPGDLPLKPLCVAMLHGERVIIYPDAWVMIQAKGGEFQVARMD